MASRSCRKYLPVLGLISIASLHGCGSHERPTVPVTGNITYNGEPLTFGAVGFSPVDPKKSSATTATVVNGQFKTEPMRGLLPGEYKLVVIPLQEEKSLTGTDHPSQRRRGEKQATTVPARYLDYKTSDITITVDPDEKHKTVEVNLED